jgi:hypothetical protein
MCGAVPPLPDMPSVYGAQIGKAQGQLYLFTFVFFFKSEVCQICVPKNIFISFNRRNQNHLLKESKVTKQQLTTQSLSCTCNLHFIISQEALERVAINGYELV